MSDAALRRELDRRRPVLMMLQAWSGRARPRYRDTWRDGHWVVAIGHDRAGVYFADPALHTSRGFLSWRELDERWHDVGYRGVHVERYGAAIWKPGVRRSRHATRVRRIQ
jgi:predicted double-glycine peptidase